MKNKIESFAPKYSFTIFECIYQDLKIIQVGFNLKTAPNSKNYLSVDQCIQILSKEINSFPRIVYIK
jgi:hypothetical protein